MGINRLSSPYIECRAFCEYTHRRFANRFISDTSETEHYRWFQNHIEFKYHAARSIPHCIIFIKCHKVVWLSIKKIPFDSCTQMNLKVVCFAHPPSSGRIMGCGNYGIMRLDCVTFSDLCPPSPTRGGLHSTRFRFELRPKVAHGRRREGLGTRTCDELSRVG
jgi:hypothetical protein